MKKRMKLAAVLLCAAVVGMAGTCLAGCKESIEDTEVMLQAPSGGLSEEASDSSSGKEKASGSSSGEETTEGQSQEGAGEDASAETVSAEEKTEPSVSENEIAAEAPAKERVKVRGIYVTGAMAGTANMDNLIALVDRTELNALVIDVKNDEGRVVYEMASPMVEEVGSSQRLVADMPALVEKCREHGIYLIGRIVAFKDPYLAENRTELALHDKEGNLFRDNSGLAWVNPYKREVWEYLMEIAGEAVKIGFDEIQFDYIRFATEKGMKNVDFGPEAAGRDKEAVITDFTAYAAEKLHEMGALVSADVYGIIIDSELDASIVGQNYYEMSKHLDYISPMVYPSHYGPGNLGLAVPDAQPYETIYRSMSASRRVLAGMDKAMQDGVSGNDVPKGGDPVNEVSESAVSGNGVSGNSLSGGVSENGAASGGVSENSVSGNSISENSVYKNSLPDPKAMEPAEEINADVRPWLQDFTASWVAGHIKYGPEEIKAQIQGVYDAGYEEWILWNAANRYTEGGLLPAEEKIED